MAVSSRGVGRVPAADAVDVTVAVVTHNSAAVLPRFFASLPSGLEGVASHEVVVADNASADDTIATVARCWPSAEVIPVGRNGGYAAGVNAAAAAGRGRAFLVCNADVRFRPGCIRALLAALELPGVGVVVAREMKPTGERDDSLRREPSLRTAFGDALLGGTLAGRLGISEAYRSPAFYEHEQTVDWASGANQLVSRACLEAAGPWDESFFLYSEETDFDLRARDAGFSLRYVPDAVIDHEGGDMATSAPLWSLRAVNRVVLYGRRHGPRATALFRLAVILHEVLRMRRSPVHGAAVRALVRHARTGAVPDVPGRGTAPGSVGPAGPDLGVDQLPQGRD